MSLIQAANPLEVSTKEDGASTAVDAKRKSPAVWRKSATIEGVKLWQFAIFLASCCVIVMRRPDMIFHAQFYAEDGAIWYATAYNYGWWRVIFSPYEGYLHLLPRLTAGLALLVPMIYAPLVETLIAVAVQALPVNLLISPRLARWGSLRFRVVLALLYLALPNTYELPGSITESQWVLALTVFLLLTASPARSFAGKTLDVSLFVLCSITGPFSIFLFPIALLFRWQNKKETRLKVASGILCVGALIQTAFLLTHHAGRHYPTLGANADSLARILSGQIYLGMLAGGNGFATHLPLAALATVAVIATAIWIACFVFSGKEPRMFVVFAVLLFCASLVSPTAFPPPGTSAWQQLLELSGIRYWFLPGLAFIWSLAYGVCSPRRGLRLACWCLLALLPIGLIRDFRYPPAADFHYTSFVRQFERDATGSKLAIPLRPDGWQAILIKH